MGVARRAERALRPRHQRRAAVRRRVRAVPQPAADAQRPSWRFLLLLGAIGGAATFFGTAIGWAYSSTVLSVLFDSLAAGSILYVIIQLLGIVARAHRNDLVAYGVLAGLFAGFATDAIVTLGGA